MFKLQTIIFQNMKILVTKLLKFQHESNTYNKQKSFLNFKCYTKMHLLFISYDLKC